MSGLGTLPQQALGAALDAIDAHDRVEQAAQERRQPGDADPGNGGTDVTLEEQDVDRHRAGDDDVQDRGCLTDQPREVCRQGHSVRRPL